MTEITVTGGADAVVPADRAELSASVTRRGSDRAQVIAEAGKAHAALVARASELVAEGAAVEYVAAPVSSYSSSWSDDSGATVVEHQASVNIRIMLIALDRVGEISAEATASGADVRVSWELSDEVRREETRGLRGKAVADARAAAEDYAAAIGAMSLSMVSLRDEAPGYRPMPMRHARAVALEAAPEVTVEDLAVSVSVTVTFTAV